MLYQLHFDNYNLFVTVDCVVQDLIYVHKVKGKLYDLTKSIKRKFTDILNSLPDWGYQDMINHSITLNEEEALFLSDWLQANSNYYPNLAALQGTLKPLHAAA
jgi:hypothetical protein